MDEYGELSDREVLRDAAARRGRRYAWWGLAVGGAVLVIGGVLGASLAVRDGFAEGGHRVSVSGVVLVVGLGLVLSAMPLSAFVIMRRRARDPVLVLGADRATRAAVRRALRDGRTADPRIDVLARDLAQRTLRNRWARWGYAVAAALVATGLVMRIVSGEVTGYGVVLPLGSLVLTGIGAALLVRDGRRAARYLDRQP
jgi:MFS family permease